MNHRAYAAIHVGSAVYLIILMVKNETQGQVYAIKAHQSHQSFHEITPDISGSAWITTTEMTRSR